MNLLGVLGAREVNGRDLAKRYAKETGESISYGTLYTAMRRLKESGWVDSRDDDKGDRRVRLFKLTGNGEIAFRRVHEMSSLFAGREATT